MHITMFKAIDWFMDDPIEIIETPYENIEKMEKQGVAFSLFDKGICLGCGGFIVWENNTSEAWVRISRRGFEHKRAGIRAIRDGFDILKRVSVTPMFCWVNTEWPEAQRLVKWLGFIKTKNCVKREINGKNYFMWELNDGNYIDDSRASCVSHGADATSLDDETTGRSSGPNIRI